MIQRFQRVMKEHGFGGGLVHLIHRLSPVHFKLIFEIEQSLNLAATPQLSIIRYSHLADMDSKVLQAFAKTRGTRLIREFEQLFRIGAQIWIGFWEGEAAGICWSRSGQNREDYFIPLTTNDANILSCFVFPQFRGRGIYPSMLKYIVYNLKNHNGIRRICIDCQSHNKPSIRGIEKAGFRFIGKTVCIFLFDRVVFKYPRYIVVS